MVENQKIYPKGRFSFFYLIDFLKKNLIISCLIISSVSSLSAQPNISLSSEGKDSSPVVSVNSNTATFDQVSGMVTFDGDVVAEHGDLRIKASRLIALYSPESGMRELKEVLGSGGVQISQGTDIILGGEFIYLVEQGVFFVTDDVQVTDGNSVFSGEKLTYEVNTGGIILENSVRAIFGPERELP